MSDPNIFEGPIWKSGTYWLNLLFYISDRVADLGEDNPDPTADQKKVIPGSDRQEKPKPNPKSNL